MGEGKETKEGKTEEPSKEVTKESGGKDEKKTEITEFSQEGGQK